MDPTVDQALALTGMKDKTPADLVADALAGNAAAWNEIVDRYERLVWSVVRGYRLDNATSSDVAQTVWLELVENLDRIRDPERLPAWLATTARHESLRVAKAQKRMIPSDFEYDTEDTALPAVDASLLQDEEQRDVLRALAHLDDGCQQLLRLLTTDPPLDYDTIADIVGRPKGSIGPTRARCLDKLRRHLGAGERS
jgi:RNA polymerase sigma factor (sigma-70 family)